jgi:hypothetical protein
MTQRFLLLLLAWLLLSVSAMAQTVSTPQTKVNIIIDRESVRFAPQELALEMRLVITDQSGAELYDSSLLSVSTLDWLLRDSRGEAVKGGLYLYTLNIKDAAGAVSERRGYLIVNRAGDGDHIYVATGDKVGIGAGNEASSVTVVSGPDATVGGAALSGGLPRREDSGARAELPQRSVAEDTTKQTAAAIAKPSTAPSIA